MEVVINAALPVYASAMYTHTGHGTDDYRIGSMLDGALGTSYQPMDGLQVLSQLNLKLHARDEEPGVDPGSHASHAENTGGTALYLGAAGLSQASVKKLNPS